MAEITDVLNNPYTGWAPWAEYGPYPQPHRLVYALVKWSEIEPVKGNFNWSNIETRLKFDYWTERSVKFILRLEMDHPGSDLSHKDIPEWLYSEINREGTFYTAGSSGGFSPNYSNTVLLANHQRMITAMGQRYNNDPRIAFIALGSIGHWGEFHTYYVQPGASGYMPAITISDQYVRHYLNAFPSKKLLMRRPFQIAKDNRMGLYNDMFGNPTETQRFLNQVNSGYTNSGNYGVAAGTYPAMPDFWRYAPSGGEIGDCPGLQYLQNSTIQRTIQYAVSSHTSWLGPCCPANQPVNSSLQANINSLHNILGYRFVIQSESHPSSINTGSVLNVTMQINNKGAAPFYFNWPLELSLSAGNNSIAVKSNTSEDIRTWLPGVWNTTLSLNIPQNLAAGNYSLCLAIIDPETGSPGIDFANTGRRSDGRYLLGQVTVASGQATNIVINGDASDWNNISPIAASTLMSLKAANNAIGLYVCAQGTGLNVKSQFFFDTDNNSATGYKALAWSVNGCEYLLENNLLFRYFGNGYSWTWRYLGYVWFAKNNTIIEAAIPLNAMQLAAGRTIRLGFLLINPTYSRLPASTQPLAAFTLK